MEKWSWFVWADAKKDWTPFTDVEIHITYLVHTRVCVYVQVISLGRWFLAQLQSSSHKAAVYADTAESDKNIK